LAPSEPPASAGASRAVRYDVDRDVDCTDPTGACGEYVSVSIVDNVDYLVVHDPLPGADRLKVVLTDASPTLLPWGMSAVTWRRPCSCCHRGPGGRDTVVCFPAIARGTKVTVTP
jgi:hypothetical protein